VLVCLFFFFILSTPLRAQEDTFKIYLVGDAGEDTKTGPTLQSLQDLLAGNPNSAVIFLGDNSYRNSLGGIIPFGFKGFDSSSLTQKKIRSQLDILNGYRGSVFFLPGNHDWWNRKSFSRGQPKLKMEQSFIDENLSRNPSISNPGQCFFPRDGSPGPDAVDLNQHAIRLVMIDTYRLILPGFKKDLPDSTLREESFYHALDSLLHDGRLKNQQILVVAHHPVYAHGPHTKPLKNYKILKRIKASNMGFPSYKKMAGRMLEILKKYPGTYYASGHIHGLYYASPADSVHYIISGAGSKIHEVKEKDLRNYEPSGNAEFPMWNNKGYFEIDFFQGGQKIYLYYDGGHQKCELVPGG
jgi:hypothetical protein